mmetsp:Transcript_31513/g.32064  ORF Transcript_31513/g.32064 Transcript_31513/m.32064 type:complete len:531 (+) Transcript_31513:82-1674(+)
MGLVVDVNGVLYIADAGDDTIKRINLRERERDIVSTVNIQPADRDSNNQLYDSTDLTALENTLGRSLSEWSLSPAADIQRAIESNGLQDNFLARQIVGRTRPLLCPTDLTIADAFVYVSAAGSHQVWRIEGDGFFVRPAFGSGILGRRDCMSSIAFLSDKMRMSSPSGIAYSKDRIYVADADAGSVRALNIRESTLLKTYQGGSSTLLAGERFSETVSSDDLSLSLSGDVDSTADVVRFRSPAGMVRFKGREGEREREKHDEMMEEEESDIFASSAVREAANTSRRAKFNLHVAGISRQLQQELDQLQAKYMLEKRLHLRRQQKEVTGGTSSDDLSRESTSILNRNTDRILCNDDNTSLHGIDQKKYCQQSHEDSLPPIPLYQSFNNNKDTNKLVSILPISAQELVQIRPPIPPSFAEKTDNSNLISCSVSSNREIEISFSNNMNKKSKDKEYCVFEMKETEQEMITMYQDINKEMQYGYVNICRGLWEVINCSPELFVTQTQYKAAYKLICQVAREHIDVIEEKDTLIT